jgi:hypothetical protein
MTVLAKYGPDSLRANKTPQRSEPSVHNQGVSERVSPTFCLLKLHLTSGVLCILVAAVPDFLECCFFNDLE